MMYSATAEAWLWCSLAQRAVHQGLDEAPLLSDWPLPRPKGWTRWVNRPQAQPEPDALRLSVSRGRPFGTDEWQSRTAQRLGLEFTLHPRGRPRKPNASSKS